MIPPAFKSWFFALAIALAMPVVALPTGGGGGGGITILPSAQYAVMGTVLQVEQFDDYRATGASVTMPIAETAVVALFLDGMATPAYTWTMAGSGTFVLDPALMEELFAAGETSFDLEVANSAGLSFVVDVVLETDEKAIATAKR